MIRKIKYMVRKLHIILSIRKYRVAMQIYDPWNRRKIEDVLERCCSNYASVFDSNENVMCYFIVGIRKGSSFKDVFHELTSVIPYTYVYKDSIFGIGFSVLTDKNITILD